MPISAVHPAFTAAIIHLLDLKTSDPIRRRKAMRRFEVCLKCLYEMNSNWEWANRSIRAIQSLATQWQIDIWSLSLRLHEINQINRRQYQVYEASCQLTGPDLSYLSTPNSNYPDATQARLADPCVEFFDAWTYDQAFMDGTFDFFDGNWFTPAQMLEGNIFYISGRVTDVSRCGKMKVQSGVNLPSHRWSKYKAHVSQKALYDWLCVAVFFLIVSKRYWNKSDYLSWQILRDNRGIAAVSPVKAQLSITVPCQDKHNW